jgi:hypothetical protein
MTVARPGEPEAPPPWWPRLTVGLAVLGWAMAVWMGLRPPSLVSDWNGWRQADTQTIALNLAQPDGRLLYPRIAWGGDGPGYVESELQLYPWLFAPILRRVGPAEWPGQITSLVSFSLAGLLLGWALLEQFGPGAAVLGAASFLSTRGALHLAVSVQPEALVALLFVAAWWAFLRFEAGGGSAGLVVFATVGALAMLVKPGAAQFGIASFLLLAMRSRLRLRSARVWLAWGTMVLALLAHLAFAREIFLEYGNTFGVLSGGDSKLPRLEHLLRPGLYLEAARIAILWGVGPVAATCAAVLVLRRRLGGEELALLAGAVSWTILTLRYSSEETYGSHYPVLAGVFGAWCVARTVRSLAESKEWARPCTALLAAAILIQLGESWVVRRRHEGTDRGASCIASLADAVRSEVAPGDLVVVRAGANAYDRYWKTPNNYEDPRPFYLTGTHGWVLAADEDDPAVLQRMAARGARAYLEPESRYGTPAIGRWLVASARPLAEGSCGRAWALAGAQR